MLKRLIIISFLLLNFYPTANAQLKLTSTDQIQTMNVNPGDTIETNIEVTNFYNEKTKIHIYAVDGTKTQTGDFAAKLLEHEQLFFGQWATFENNIIELDPKTSSQVKLTINIPDNATPGDYSGGICASRIFEQAATETQEVSVAPAISFTTRIAIPFYINIQGERTVNFKISDLTYKKTHGSNYEMLLNLKNDGNTSIKTVINPSIKSIFGETENLETKEILFFPKEDVTVPIALNNMPIFGIYDLRTDVTYSEHNLLENTDTLIETVTRTSQLIIIPWLQIILVLSVLIIIALYFIVRKWNINRIRKSSMKYKVKPGDTVAALAKENRVYWKTIIKINELKPPYEIKPGQEILIPQKKK